MQVNINNCSLEIIRGDISVQDTDAVVNAANAGLAPGGGVSGAIHRAAGPGLWEECKKIGGCNTGEAVLTAGYDLQAEYVIHAVGPVYSGAAEDAELLAACYTESLKIASGESMKSISFPAISTGIFGYPVIDAAQVSLHAVIDYLEEKNGPGLVRFVLFDQRTDRIFTDTLSRIKNG